MIELYGRVEAGEDVQPIAGAAVHLNLVVGRAGGLVARCMTDSAGTFTASADVDPTAAYGLELFVSAPGRLSQHAFPGTSRPADLGVIRVHAGDDEHPAPEWIHDHAPPPAPELRVPIALEVRGPCAFETDSYPAASFALEGCPDYHVALDVRPDGRFEEWTVPPGRYEVCFWAEDHPTQEFSVDASEDGTWDPPRLEVVAGGRLSGRVTDAQGRPVENCFVRRSDALRQEPHRRDRVAGDGSYEVKGLLGRRWFGIESGEFERRSFELDFADGQNKRCDVTLWRAGEPRPHIPTDPDLDAYERRAAALARDVPQAPDALLRSVVHQLRRYRDRPLGEVRAAFSVGEARLVIAREHGAADWEAFGRQLQGLIEDDGLEPLRAAVLAVRAGDFDRVRLLVPRNGQILGQRGTHGHTLLGLACIAATNHRAIPPRPAAAGVREAVRVLLDLRADMDAAADHGWTPLHTAGFAGDAELARTLLDAGASPRAEAWETEGATPLSYTLFYGHREAAAELARETVAPDNLRTAAGLGDVERLRAFFDDGGALLESAGRGRGFYRPLFLFPRWTPSDNRQEWLDEALTWSARSGRVEAMAELVARGAGVDSNAYRGTPLLWATYADRVDAARWLLDRGADPSLRHDFGGAQHGAGATALHLAAQYGCLRCLRLLIERGADPSIRDELHGSTPLGWAEFAGQDEAVAILRG